MVWSQVRVFKNKICQSSTRPTGLRFQPSKGSYSYLRNVQQSHLHVTKSLVSTNPPNQHMYGNPFEKKKRIWRSFEVLSDWTVTFGHTCLVWCYPRFFSFDGWLPSCWCSTSEAVRFCTSTDQVPRHLPCPKKRGPFFWGGQTWKVVRKRTQKKNWPWWHTWLWLFTKGYVEESSFYGIRIYVYGPYTH